VSVAIGRLDFEYAFSKLQYRDIEGTTTEVIYRYGLFFLLILVETISKACCSRFIDDSLYLETGNSASIFGSLSL